MGIRAFVVVGLTACLGAGASLVACGGEEEPSSPLGSDASADGASDGSATPDATADSGKDNCDTSTDFLGDIPDSSIADGASSSGVCIGCLREHCEADLDKCGASCECRGFVGETLGCFAQAQDTLQNCALKAALTGAPSDETRNVGLGILGCTQEHCKEACAVDKLLPGEDAGPGTDASGDDASAGDASDLDASEVDASDAAVVP